MPQAADTSPLPSTSSCCRVLYSTQSGRAQACARRTARRLSESTGVRLLNRTGSTFDEELYSHSYRNGGSCLVNFVSKLKQEPGGGAFLLLFVSTTGDGEHTDTIRKTWNELYVLDCPLVH